MNYIKLHSISRVKVNLYLHVIGKRKDGYHNLDSLVAFPNIGDKIEIYPSKNINLTIKGRLKKELPTKENLILKASKLFKNNKNGADIHVNDDEILRNSSDFSNIMNELEICANIYFNNLYLI